MGQREARCHEVRRGEPRRDDYFMISSFFDNLTPSWGEKSARIWFKIVISPPFFFHPKTTLSFLRGHLLLFWAV